MARPEKIIKKEIPFKVKGWQLMALHAHGNTICRASWPYDKIIEAFKGHNMEVEVYEQQVCYGGYETLTIVNTQHPKYDYIVGGINHE